MYIGFFITYIIMFRALIATSKIILHIQSYNIPPSPSSFLPFTLLSVSFLFSLSLFDCLSPSRELIHLHTHTHPVTFCLKSVCLISRLRLLPLRFAYFFSFLYPFLFFVHGIQICFSICSPLLFCKVFVKIESSVEKLFSWFFSSLFAPSLQKHLSENPWLDLNHTQ